MKNSKIIIKCNSLKEIGREIKKLKVHKIGVVTTKKIAKNLNKKLASLLDETTVFYVKEGEKCKDLKTVKFLWKKLIENNFTRQSCLIALGGGSIIDVTGFVASTFMRGIHLINVPTTLLAQVDASIGGKNSIDFEGKNLIGTFYQPDLVIVDPTLLLTLPSVEFKNALAEILKYGLIWDKKFFDFIVKNWPKIQKDLSKIESLIKKCVKIKLYFVSRDEKDFGIRRILNFGHTIAHAIEDSSNFSIQHGYALSIGMLVACKISEKILGFREFPNVKEALERLGFPTKCEINYNKILKAMQKDKKAWYGKITMVLLKKIGKPKILEVHSNIISECLKEILEVE
jgi:3-dehydroquinate synthase